MKPLLTVIFLSYAVFIQAQIGYFNSTQLIATLQETKVADQKLEALRDSLSTAFENERKKLEATFTKHQTDYNNGLLSAIEIQKITEDLSKQEEELKRKQSQFQFTILQRREKLYQPTFTRVDEVVQAIGRSRKYTLIFDTSKQLGFLYLNEGNDITDQIRQALQ